MRFFFSRTYFPPLYYYCFNALDYYACELRCPAAMWCVMDYPAIVTCVVALCSCSKASCTGLLEKKTLLQVMHIISIIFYF